MDTRRISGWVWEAFNNPADIFRDPGEGSSLFTQHQLIAGGRPGPVGFWAFGLDGSGHPREKFYLSFIIIHNHIIYFLP